MEGIARTDLAVLRITADDSLALRKLAAIPNILVTHR